MIGPVAYMDPGTGSLFLQLLLGGVAGAAVILKLYWHRLLGLFGARRGEASAAEARSHEDVAGDEGSPKP